ncbi:response regulator transcription factor [Caproiciproducens sp. NJN-50]|uniref:response regulator transcription factor n=1 Tax=Caproiciproducens sp. NJN-50 TaxID=2507162 RepID=UPI000FFDF7B2|nr:response regulator transcription factor [Caproiciproducens sp. NJN-50]QAT50990.1 response regulator transcription factor [Caproiciproducens sp. NJN-50]
MYQITIVEDDPVIQEELSTLLQSNGYAACVIKEFSNIVETVRKDIPHLILLDINLPVQDGFKICSKIRTFSNVPIIFVTSRNTDIDELNSIMLGGDDFITKPYNTSIMLARITSLLKRAYPSEQAETMTYKDVTLHLESSCVEFQKQSVELTKNELKIMAFLYRNAGKIVPRADLVEYLWDNQLYVDDNALSVNITRLREKLKQIGIIDFITTKHRQGYMI